MNSDWGKVCRCSLNKSKLFIDWIFVWVFVCRSQFADRSLWHCQPLYYAYNHCAYVYDPTNAAAVSAGSQIDYSLWPTRADWVGADLLNDSGVYAATTPWYAVTHTMNHHPVAIAKPAGHNNIRGLMVYEITINHPQYNQFRNSANPNFVRCTNKIIISPAVLNQVPNQLTVTIIW